MSDAVNSGRRTVASAARRLLGLSAFLLVSPLATASLAETGAKTVQCRIESDRKVEFNGNCRFLPDGANGSFSLSSATGRSVFYGSILSVSVSVVSPGVAEVRGLTKDGINSRWGEAKRSAQDRACWVASDFKVCAR